MWIITHDNVHEAGINPALNVPKSHDYMTQATRKKAASRRNIFRLIKDGKELFRGIAYFEKDATFSDILRPLDEFGRAQHGCDGIEYLCRNPVDTPIGKTIWNMVPEELGRAFDKRIGVIEYYGGPDHSFSLRDNLLETYTVSVGGLLKEMGLDSIVEVEGSYLRAWFDMHGG